jgi:hypothetical protein
MRNACDNTNVVEAANTDGRQERLENMLVQLEQCQKALQVLWLAKEESAATTVNGLAFMLSQQ